MIFILPEKSDIALLIVSPVAIPCIKREKIL